ncbi:hypothetical protein CPT_Mano_055 [Achromobacter phage Mano]|uniref:Uncharacterized protein n=1 Tax=Achromobacter phage Mano TaxID=2767570 RepID=A0A7L8G6F0_9CAUD|nr:hypothetical protein KB680_gp36 [Achromobacter phage Mano]QOE32787.1 hypothetical protein CPT_Mano_055 [Achromobacter phage Mano]
MNAKKAKALRKLVRAAGVAVGHATYKSDDPGQRAYNTGKLDAKGRPIFGTAEITGTVRLARNCGRWLYKRLKAGAAMPA